MFLAVTYITWTEPPPAWNQTSQSDFRTVDILVFNRSTQVHLKWNYILSAGSNLQSTTFSIIDERSINGIGAIYHGSDTTAIFDGYRTRFNISRSEVATLIINRATEREEATYQCLLTTTTNQWRYNVRVKLTGKCNGVTVYSPIYVNNKYVIYSCMQAYYIYNVRVGPSRHRPEEELTL